MSHDVSDFDREVLQRSRQEPVLCDFWAPWCGPCRMLGPALEKLAAASGGTWTLAKVNVEEDPATARRFRIKSIPAVKLFHQGEVVAEFVGALPEAALRQWLSDHLPAAGGVSWREAEQALEALDFARAEAALAALPADADPTRRQFLLAKAVLWREPLRALSLLREADSPELPESQVEAVRLLAAQLSAAPAAAGAGADELRYAEVLRTLARADLTAAMESLAALLWENPRHGEGSALRLMRALLLYLGSRHPLAERHLRAYSAAASLR